MFFSLRCVTAAKNEHDNIIPSSKCICMYVCVYECVCVCVCVCMCVPAVHKVQLPTL